MNEHKKETNGQKNLSIVKGNFFKRTLKKRKR